MIETFQQFRQFAHEHDEIPAFHAAYIVAAIFISLLFHLGAFALLILFHILLDVFKYREIHGYSLRETVRAALLESIVDIALFFFALTLSVYVHNTLLITMLGGFTRSELTIVQFLGSFFAKLKILENFFELFTYFHAYMHTPTYGRNTSLTRAEWWSAVFSVFCIILLFSSLFFYWGHLGDLWYILRVELSIFS
jgi:hypothetical protein